jgi:arylsulfatase
LLLCACAATPRRAPNIIYILADDLGYGELGCYGQEKIRTPRLDTLAAEGMRFTRHYSGSAVCAPARCSLLTGMHQGHASIRGNDEVGSRGDVWRDPELEGQRPMPASDVTVAELLKQAGYATAAIGKWGLGWMGSSGDPLSQGFDLFFGYNCQRIAHSYYPVFLWRNHDKVYLDNDFTYPHEKLPAGLKPENPASYERYSSRDYAMDRMTEEALSFVRANAERPFFLYLPYPVPHVALQVPEDSLAEYEGAFPETPSTGGKGYLPHHTPRAAYAAMITRMDRDIGRLLDLLDELELTDDTLVVFTSDNGPTYAGGVDYEFFKSAGELRGLKGSLFEGGVRVPMLARWPGQIPAGSESDHLSAHWDVLPTLCAVAGMEAPDEVDGISFLPTLLEQGENQDQHASLYWEHARRWQAAIEGPWKAVRRKPGEALMLFNLESDPAEKHNLADDNPDLVTHFEELFANSRTQSEHFSLQAPKKENG